MGVLLAALGEYCLEHCKTVVKDYSSNSMRKCPILISKTKPSWISRKTIATLIVK
jgi:hypothetical protein